MIYWDQVITVLTQYFYSAFSSKTITMCEHLFSLQWSKAICRFASRTCFFHILTRINFYIRYSITEFENYDTKIYMIPYSSIPMNQINENIPRLEKAWKLVREGNVILQSNPLRAIVKGSEINYIVNIAAQDCTCADHKFRPELICKHIRAAELERQLQIGEITLEVKN